VHDPCEGRVRFRRLSACQRQVVRGQIQQGDLVAGLREVDGISPGTPTDVQDAHRRFREILLKHPQVQTLTNLGPTAVGVA